MHDTGTTLEHGRLIREELRRRGAGRITVVLSHWHLDHVAGTEAFAGSPVISNERTAEHLREKRAAIEDGTLEGPPAISPLVMPTRTFAERETLTVGATTVELIAANIHSDDQTVLWLPERRLLFCADAMEDTDHLRRRAGGDWTPTSVTSSAWRSSSRPASSPPTATPT